MKPRTIRRLVMVMAVVIFIGSIVLLLNFTAPNPTGRRYSSESVVRTGEGTSGEIGLSGERILAKDLGIPRNEAPDQRQCLCDAINYRPGVADCRVCIAQVQLTAAFRRPDFVAPDYIAESKNSQGLLYSGRDINEIGDYVFGARASNRPLWIFTRVDANVDPEFIRLAESTGGGVVKYFTYPGYVDPWDQRAQAGVVGSLGVLILFGLWEFVDRGRNGKPKSPKPKRKKNPSDPFAEFDDLKENTRRKIDEEDARDDLR